MEEKIQKQPNPYLIPASIIVAGAFIGAALYFGSSAPAPSAVVENQPTAQAEPAQPADLTGAVRPVDEADHIKGDINAPIKIVEYSDFECPFCKRFHDTMNEVMDTYGESGEVAWVFRQFPLEQLHPVKAQRAAVAAECAAELGGNDSFWTFTDGYFADPSTGNNRTNQDVLIPELAAAAGLDSNQFNECLESGKYDNHIEADVANAIETGGRGTPWSVVIGPDGETYPVNGALPTEAITQLIEQLLAKNN